MNLLMRPAVKYFFGFVGDPAITGHAILQIFITNIYLSKLALKTLKPSCNYCCFSLELYNFFNVLPFLSYYLCLFCFFSYEYVNIIYYDVSDYVNFFAT